MNMQFLNKVAAATLAIIPPLGLETLAKYLTKCKEFIMCSTTNSAIGLETFTKYSYLTGFG